jgi:hypothetical protein
MRDERVRRMLRMLLPMTPWLIFRRWLLVAERESRRSTTSNSLVGRAPHRRDQACRASGIAIERLAGDALKPETIPNPKEPPKTEQTD